MLVRWSAEKKFSETSIIYVRRLPVFFNAVWFIFIFSFQVIKRSALTI